MKELQAERDYLTGRKEDLREKRDTMRKERAAFRAEKEALAAELSSLKEDYRVRACQWWHGRHLLDHIARRLFFKEQLAVFFTHECDGTRFHFTKCI